MKRYLLLCVLLFLLVAAVPTRKGTSYQAGTTTLNFENDTVVGRAITFSPTYTTPPVILCSLSNGSAEPVIVSCQALTTETGVVSAEYLTPQTTAVIVNWVAVGPTQ